ncbi:MAG: hypothetical protein CM1200mP18_00920 [Gammaproteobacteria bacterium]|nr:MAG: hypothetical protein CM1200mP18_00920 [Gammaproteobacteria bacterium]
MRVPIIQKVELFVASRLPVRRGRARQSPKITDFFNESNEFPSGDKIFTTYRVSGEFFDTGPFDVRAIDIYSFRGDKICSKDTYWKIITC